MLSEAYGGETMKKSSVFEWHKRFKESSHVGVTSECNAQEYFSLRFHSKKPKSQPNLLCENNEAVTLSPALKKGPYFGPTIRFFTLTMLQLTRRSVSGQAVSGPKIGY
jgi:hypothetical protein